MLRIVDLASSLAGHLAAWLFLATGAMLSYEVIARYVFSAPTIWAAEISQLLLIWGVFLALARCFHFRQHISIDIVYGELGSKGRKLADVAATLVIAAISIVIVYYGFDIAYDSLIKGRSTGTMLNIPNWWSEMSVPVGFALLALQALAELARIFGRDGAGEPQPGEPRQ